MRIIVRDNEVQKETGRREPQHNPGPVANVRIGLAFAAEHVSPLQVRRVVAQE